MKVRDAIKLIEADGWVMLPRTATSHRQFKHPIKPGRVTISGHPGDDLSPRLKNSILRQARAKMIHMPYAVIFEKTRTGYGAYVPDLPGCIATGRTLAITRKLMREAIALHLAGMKEDGIRAPRPTTVAEEVRVDAA